jgi:type I restriction enzyme S subunit
MDTKALRQKILDLAIRGKLVPQDPNDEPAEVLLERIREQKQQMLKEGKLKKKDIKNDTIIFKGEDNLHYEKFQDGTIKCIEDEIPFEVPEGWAWCKLNDIYNFIDYRGATPTKITNGIPLVTAKNVKSGYIDYTIDDYISEEEFKERQQRGISKKGDILFTTEAPLGNAALADMEKFSAGQRLITFQQYGSKNELINYVMLMFILSDFFQQQLYVNKTGSTVAGIKAAILKTLWIPVPPYNEQLRISNTLKSAINLIDSISKNKEILSTSISNTKSKILDLAIRGKLVPQDPNDEPASVLLERISAEKEELIKQGKIKRDKKESVIFKGDDNSYYEKLPDEKINCIDKQLPFELPDGWKWCNLSMIGTTNIGLTYRPADIDTQGIIVLRSCNIVNDRINRTDLVRVKTSIRENQFVQKDDILICARNGSRSLVGKCALIPELAEKVSFGAFMAVYRTPYFSYIVHFLRSNFFRSVFDDSNSTAINQLTQDMLKRAVVPLPPLAEQLRIVDKITELFERLNCIEESLN